MTTLFTEEFHQQLQAACRALAGALREDDPFLIEIARARIRELGEIARRHYEPRPDPAPQPASRASVQIRVDSMRPRGQRSRTLQPAI